MIMGALLFVAGLIITFVGRIPRLPGDLIIERPNMTVFVPIGTMILVSVVLTLLLNVLFHR